MGELARHGEVLRVIARLGAAVDCDLCLGDCLGDDLVLVRHRVSAVPRYAARWLCWVWVYILVYAVSCRVVSWV